MSLVSCVNTLPRGHHSDLARYLYCILVYCKMTFIIVVHIFLFPSLQIEDGDIICFQKSAPLESEEQCRYPDVTSFLEYVQNRQV